MSEGLTGIAALEAEMRDRIAAKNTEIEKLRLQLVKCRDEAIEQCAKIAESAPAKTLHFWDGAPGNGYLTTTGKDIAAMIRLSKLRGSENIFSETDEQGSSNG